ncbi:DUF1534 domain-containing protein, partial [Pseudomonas syringae]|nr:DUF1534 domain-containing protein [Pseudomonas syringae]
VHQRGNALGDAPRHRSALRCAAYSRATHRAANPAGS